MKLNVGCGRDIKEGWLNLDSQPSAGVDIVFDLEKCAEEWLPLDSDCIDEFLLSNIIEHMRNPLPLMQELHRVAMPGAGLIIACPYGSSNNADEDPTHVRHMFEGSFGYFGQPHYWRADYGYRGDWSIERVILKLAPGGAAAELIRADEKPWHEAMRFVRMHRNQVDEMVAVLRAVKPIREQRRELQDKLRIELVPPPEIP